MRTVLSSLRGRARDESSAIDPHHNRQLPALGLCWDPHVQEQAIFPATSVAKVHVAKHFSLHAMRAEFRGLAHARPFRRGYGRLPAQIAHRWRGVWDTKKGVHRPIVLALDRARVGFY